MPGPKPPEVALSPDERQELVRLTRAHKTPQHVSFRAQVILQLADGHNTREVADALSTSRLTRQTLAATLAGAARMLRA